MMKIFASVLTILLVVAMSLSAMFILVRATLYVTSIPSPVERAGAIVAELLLGVVLLLGTVWLATHLAVRIFSTPEAERSLAATAALREKESGAQGDPLG